MLNRFFVLGSLIGATTLFAPITTANVAAETLIAQRDNRYIVTTSAQQGTLYLNKDKRYSYNLEVTRGGRFSGLNLPPGAIIRGQYVPADGGCAMLPIVLSFVDVPTTSMGVQTF